MSIIMQVIAAEQANSNQPLENIVGIPFNIILV